MLSLFCSFFFSGNARAFAEQIEQKKGKATLRLEAEHVDAGAVTLRLSDEIKVTLSIQGGPDLSVEILQPIAPSRDWHERKRSRAEKTLRTDGSYEWHQSFNLDPLKPGDLSLTLAPLRFRDPPADANWREVQWAPVLAHVTTQVANLELASLRDIAPLEEPPGSPSRRGVVALAIASLCLVGLLIGAGEFWRRRIRHKPAVPAHLWALKELQSLEALSPESHAELQSFHSRLSDILRRYFELRFQLPGFTRTTVEFLELLQSASPLGGDQRAAAAEVLHECDLVKFARATPDVAQCRSLVLAARSLVEQTAEFEKADQKKQPA
jgi:hypothetical protein